MVDPGYGYGIVAALGYGGPSPLVLPRALALSQLHCMQPVFVASEISLQM